MANPGEMLPFLTQIDALSDTSGKSQLLWAILRRMPEAADAPEFAIRAYPQIKEQMSDPEESKAMMADLGLKNPKAAAALLEFIETPMSRRGWLRRFPEAWRQISL